jgi:pyridinium-3,5-biscarboxylic acid mononucleotide synthase
MDLKDILLDYYNDKKSLDDVIKNISLFSIEYIENNIAQIDVNRDLRKFTPEVILAINKNMVEIVSISNKIMEKKGFYILKKKDILSKEAIKALRF